MVAHPGVALAASFASFASFVAAVDLRGRQRLDFFTGVLASTTSASSSLGSAVFSFSSSDSEEKYGQKHLKNVEIKTNKMKKELTLVLILGSNDLFGPTLAFRRPSSWLSRSRILDFEGGTFLGSCGRASLLGFRLRKRINKRV